MNRVLLERMTATRSGVVLSMIAIAAMAATAPSSASAQGVAASGTARADESDTLGEVVVTARRREESLQTVPISIAALGAADLKERNIVDLRDVNGEIPNVVIATGEFAGSISGQFSMRGIQGVVVYQDGAPIDTSLSKLPNFSDIERVEVLRGPQGTLFGRAAIGGAIQIVTRKPSNTFSADVDTQFGTHNQVNVTSTVNIPVTDTLYVKVTGQSLNQDGYVGSTKVNTKFGSQDDKTGRVDILWKPVDSFEARVQLSRIENLSSGVPYVNMNLQSVCNNSQAPSTWFNGNGSQRFFAPNAYCLYTTLNLPSTGKPYDTEFQSYGARHQYLNTISSTDTSFQQHINDVRADLKWDINDAMTLRSISSSRKGSYRSYQDLDATGLDLWVNQLNNFQNLSQLNTSELQFIYSTSRLSGTTGVYWEHDPGYYNRRINWINNDLAQDPELAAAANAAYPGSAVNPLFGGHPESAPQLLGSGFIGIGRTAEVQKAAYTEWTLSVTDQFKVTAGLRYTHQDTTTTNFKASPFPGGQTLLQVPALYQNLIPGGNYFAGIGTPFVNEQTVTQTTPRVSLQYQWTPAIMTYATFSKGASTNGGLTVVNANQTALLGIHNYFTSPQLVKNYEVGMRTDLFDGTLRVNASVYYDPIKNAALTEELLPGQLFPANNVSATDKGFELEGTWLVTHGFSVNYAFGYVDAKYTSLGSAQNLTLGTPFALTPKTSYALGAQYAWNVPNGAEIVMRGDYNYQAAQNSAVDRINNYTIPGYGLLNARLTFRPSVGNWEVALSGTNLTDKWFLTSAFYQPQTTAVSATVGRPREAAISFLLHLK
jgi:iron complex outermembrane recepter protein